MFSIGKAKNLPCLTGLQYPTYIDEKPSKVAEGAEGEKNVFPRDVNALIATRKRELMSG